MTDDEILETLREKIAQFIRSSDSSILKSISSLLWSFPDLLIPVLETELTRPRDRLVNVLEIVAFLSKLEQPPIPLSILRRVKMTLLLRSSEKNRETLSSSSEVSDILSVVASAPDFDLTPLPLIDFSAESADRIIPILKMRWAALINQLNCTTRQIKFLRGLEQI